MGMIISSVVKKGRSMYVSMRPVLLEEVGWRRGDRLAAVVVDGDVVLRKIRTDELEDAIKGAMYRRKKSVKKKPIDGIWNQRRVPKI